MEIVILLLVLSMGVFIGHEIGTKSDKPWPLLVVAVFAFCFVLLLFGYPNDARQTESFQMIANGVELSRLKIRLDKPYRVQVSYARSLLWLRPDFVSVVVSDIVPENATGTERLSVVVR